VQAKGLLAFILLASRVASAHAQSSNQSDSSVSFLNRPSESVESASLPIREAPRVAGRNIYTLPNLLDRFELDLGGLFLGCYNSLGYKPPVLTFGPTLYIAANKWVEFSAGGDIGLARKWITNDGHSASFGGGMIAWMPGQKIGVFVDVGKTYEWTSQFKKHSFDYSYGLTFRTQLAHFPTRISVDYVLPTGCVWATQTNPCTIQSSRLQGPEVNLNQRVFPNLRWASTFGLYHFCEQGNPFEPQAGRKCHIGYTIDMGLYLEFRGKRSRRQF
jgi:hypothetical protein